jgi:hypothetical protein
MLLLLLSLLLKISSYVVVEVIINEISGFIIIIKLLYRSSLIRTHKTIRIINNIVRNDVFDQGLGCSIIFDE